MVGVSSGTLAVKFFYGGVEEIPENGVRIKTFSAHIVFNFGLGVRRKRFSLHGKTILSSQQGFVRRWNNRTQIGANYGFSYVIWSKYFIFRCNRSSFVDVFTI